MKSVTLLVALVAGSVLVMAPGESAAQGPPDWVRDRIPVQQERDGWEDRDGRDDDRWERRRDQGGRVVWDRRRSPDQRVGPPFCRNGQGHPVHGREWCVRKGFGLGGGLADVIRRGPRRDQGGGPIYDRRGDILDRLPIPGRRDRPEWERDRDDDRRWPDRR
ncbi:MAG: hypothetical protein ACREKN_05285 [Longimicrobiaceae bacterium]